MSSSSNYRSSQSGKFTEMGDKITKVAASAIREAAKSSKAGKSSVEKASKSIGAKKTGK
jgi:adenosylcobinamide amidohydrolase